MFQEQNINSLHDFSFKAGGYLTLEPRNTATVKVYIEVWCVYEDWYITGITWTSKVVAQRILIIEMHIIALKESRIVSIVRSCLIWHLWAKQVFWTCYLTLVTWYLVTGSSLFLIIHSQLLLNITGSCLFVFGLMASCVVLFFLYWATLVTAYFLNTFAVMIMFPYLICVNKRKPFYIPNVNSFISSKLQSVPEPWMRARWSQYCWWLNSIQIQVDHQLFFAQNHTAVCLEVHVL